MTIVKQHAAKPQIPLQLQAQRDVNKTSTAAVSISSFKKKVLKKQNLIY